MKRGKGALGLKYLLMYLTTGQDDYLKVARDCILEIRFWAIFTLLTANNDLMFEDIPNYILEDAFKNKSNKTPKNTGYVKSYDFGSGIVSTLKGNFKDQFRFIRNALVHGNFVINDDIISIYSYNNDYKATFTMEWLERLIRTTLASNTYCLKKGMREISVMSTKTKLPTNYEEFCKYLKNGNVILIELVAERSNQEKIADDFNLQIDDFERISFQTLQTVFFNQLSKLANNQPSTPDYYKYQLIIDLQDLVKSFSHIFSVNLYRPSLNEDYYQDPSFQALEPQEKFQVIADKIVSQDPFKANTIYYNHLQRFLTILKDDYNVEKGSIFYLKSAKELLIKAYANCIFLGEHIKDTHPKKKELLKKFAGQIDYHYLHAKRVYLEILKILKKVNHSLQDNNGSEYYKNKMLAYYKTYLDYMDAYLNKDEDYYLFRFIRNALVHDNVEFKDGLIRLYDFEPPIEIPTFKKKEKRWTTKKLNETSTIYEIFISEQDFIDFLTELGTYEGLELSVNISKYIKRRNYLKNN